MVHIILSLIHSNGSPAFIVIGQAAKICNNMLLGISMIGVSETMNLGKK